MSIKFYIKRGKKNYKEAKLIRELQPIIDAKLQSNPDLAENFIPASNFEELQALHRQYVAKDVEYVEIKDNMAKKQEEVEINDDNDFFKQIEESEDGSDFVDPFNREEPIVRDYVTGGGLKDETIPEGPTRTHFDEPLTFQDAFELPSNEDSIEEPKGKNDSSSEPKREKQKQQRQEPLNPSYDDMSGAKKKKSTKKFAKYIIEAVCALAEKGFVWYANKDINEAKLNEYELNGEMDLSILVTLDNGQQATVKQFFINQCYMAEELSRFEAEEKQDMADALSEVFMEKGIAPTATQEALIVIGGVLVKKGAMLLSLKAQTGSLLNQLRAMGGTERPQYQEPYYEPQPQPQPQAESAPVNEPSEEMNTFDFSSIDEIENTSDLEIEQVVETKE
jgi:hypothetical protein